jgi:hypothetical protein
VNSGFRGKAPTANAKPSDPELKLTDIERQQLTMETMAMMTG